jgi:spore maturation protein CgeB
MPMAIVEAFACGKPVIASRLGTMAEMIEDGKTGLLFNPGDVVDLTLKIQWAIDHPEGIKEMGLNARKQYEEKYTSEKNYELLMNIYEHAIENKDEILYNFFSCNDAKVPICCTSNVATLELIVPLKTLDCFLEV